MGILEELTPKESKIGKIEEFLAGLSKKDRAEWDQVLADRVHYKDSAICEALRRRGVQVDRNAIYRFREKAGIK
jgi:hypothetical protein